MSAERRLRVLTWPVHGSYLAYLAAADIDLLAVSDDPLTGYPANVIGVGSDELSDVQADVVLHQSHATWRDRDDLLPPNLRDLPAVVVEHDPPREHPTDTRHPAADTDVLLVHVTHYNALMWDAGTTPTVVVEHGVPDPDVAYRGDLDRGIVVINGLGWRGRRLGRDLFERLRDEVPLDLVGMESEELGGLGEVPRDELPAFVARYRFFLSPMRYTSLGLAILEAMAVGVPVVGLPTTELPRLIRSGENGILSADPRELVGHMRRLLADPGYARDLGAAGRRTVRERHGLARFRRAWSRVLRARADGAWADGAWAEGEQVVHRAEHGVDADVVDEARVVLTARGSDGSTARGARVRP